MDKLFKLFPAPPKPVSLQGLYLSQALRERRSKRQPFVYTNFIASLDGRIALQDPKTGEHLVPKAIANPCDWRLFQELAAQADALITSGRYIRQLARGSAQDILPLSEKPDYEDLFSWRQAHGLAPQPAVVIISANLDIPFPDVLLGSDRPIYVATGAEADRARVRAIEKRGTRVLFAGVGRRVQGRALIEVLGQEGLTTLYSIAGPEILETLLLDRVLDRLYLTQVHRMLGNESFDTLLKGACLLTPRDLKLYTLYYAAISEESPEQTFAVYECA